MAVEKLSAKIAQASRNADPAIAALAVSGDGAAERRRKATLNYIVDPTRISGGYSILKTLSYLSGFIGAEQVKDELELSRRCQEVYAPIGLLQGGVNSFAMPISARYLPTQANGGRMIHGAEELRKEIAERLVEGLGEADMDQITKALGTVDMTAGGSMVPGPQLGDLIDLQRNAEAFSRAGATSVDMPGMVMDWPKLAGGATVYWVAEAGSVTESQQTTGNLRMQAKKMGIRVVMNQEFLRFTSATNEAMVRTDMAKQMALFADLYMLQGTGGTQIKGLINYDSASSWSQGTDKLIDYSSYVTYPDSNTGYTLQPEDLVRMEGKLPDTVTGTRWLMRKDLLAAVKSRRADAVTASDGRGPFVTGITRDPGTEFANILSGTPAVPTSQISNARVRGSASNLTYIIGGDFSDWLIARFGVMEWALDPYTKLQTGQVVIQGTQFIDAGPRHAASFVWLDQVKTV